jgi:hypothetical protein
MTPVERRSNAVAVAYIRRSVEQRRPEDTDGGAGQRAEIAALAERHGDVVDHFEARDWGISGQREKREKRVGMADILTAIAAGEVSALYAYSVDRLARDDAYGLTLRDACEDARVPVHTKLDGSFDFTDDRDRDYWGRKVTDAANMGRRYTRVNLDTKEAGRRHMAECQKAGRPHNGKCDSRCAPGEHCAYKHDLGGKLAYGHDPAGHPAEDPAVVVEAYRAELSYNGAMRRLTDAGVPTRHGGPWTAHSVRLVIEREAPTLIPVQTHRGHVSAKRTHLFAGLLTCAYDGSTLHVNSRPGYARLDGTRGPLIVSYICQVAHLTGSHSPRMVSELKVRAWAEREVAGEFRARSKAPAAAPSDAIEAARKRTAAAVSTAIRNGKFAEVAALSAKLAEFERSVGEVGRRGVVIGHAIDWTRPSGEVNAALRSLWQEVRLGRDMLPVEAVGWAGPDELVDQR